MQNHQVLIFILRNLQVTLSESSKDQFKSLLKTFQGLLYQSIRAILCQGRSKERMHRIGTFGEELFDSLISTKFLATRVMLPHTTFQAKSPKFSTSSS